MKLLQHLFANAAAYGHTDSRFLLYGRCGTGLLGTHQRTCTSCHDQAIIPNACRSRACPFCRQRERAQWVASVEAQLPAVPYFHCVFTVPPELRPIARDQPAVFYRYLLAAARQALLDICQNPRHMGATPAMFAVLHTWNQRLHLHPHVHVVVSAGGLTPAGTWKWSGQPATKTKRKTTSNSKQAFLVPRNVVRKRFQTLLINGLCAAYRQGELPSTTTRWTNESTFKHFLITLRKKKWSLHMERPLSGPQAVVRYLASYVNRVALAPDRVERINDGMVTFRYQDRQNGNRTAHETISAERFLGRFRQHIPPKRFIRIRYWGLLAHRCRERCLATAATALRAAAAPPAALPLIRMPPAPVTKPTTGMRCPHCGQKTLVYAGHHTRTRTVPVTSDDFRPRLN